MPPATAQWVPPALPRRLWHPKHSLSPASLRRDGQVFPRQALPAGREAAGRRMLDGDSVSLQSPPAIMLSLRGPSEGVSFLPPEGSRFPGGSGTKSPRSSGQALPERRPLDTSALERGEGIRPEGFPFGGPPKCLAAAE